MKAVIIGGVTGGASAAARIRRLNEKAEIVMFEKGQHVSFSNCSLPYYLSGEVPSRDKLILMDPEKFWKRNHIEVRVNSEVLEINRGRKTVSVKNLETGEVYEEAYDKLVLSPGANPILPRSIKGTDLPHVFTVRNVSDIVRLKDYALGHEGEIAVVGGGFIGVETAENLSLAGKKVTLIEAAEQIMMPFDYDMVQILHKEAVDHGIRLILGDGVSRIEPDRVVLSSGTEVQAGTVVMAIGVAPDTGLAVKAGLKIGETRGIWVNHNYQTSDPDMYAVGDAIEVYNRLTCRPSRLALAGPAQRQARAAASHMYGELHNNCGVIGSCALKLFDMNAAATGLNEKTAKAAGIPYDFVYVQQSDKVSIMPDSAPLHLKLLFETPTGRILGAQAIGKGSADKRIDVIAAMITMGGTLEDLKELELCYSPVFGTAKDAVNQAALAGLNILYGKIRQIPVYDVRPLVEAGAYFIDVREVDEYAKGHVTGAVNIPLSEFRERIGEIPTDRPVYLYCRTSHRSYQACLALMQSGHPQVYNVSGSFQGLCLYEYYNDMVTGRQRIVTDYIF